MAHGNINFTQAFKRQGIVPGHLYKARVVNNNDPKKYARIRARVEGLFEGIDDSSLPWAVPRFNHWHGALETGGCSGSGSTSIPAEDTWVFLVWQSDDPHHPTYQPYTVDRKTVMKAVMEDYPRTHVVYRFLNCSILKINTKTNRLYLYNSGDVDVRIDGETKITVKGDSDLHVAGKVVGDIYGDATFSIRKSDLRERTDCPCPEGDNTGGTYPDGGTGTLTVNIKDYTIVNGENHITVNARRDVYVNVDRDLHATVGRDTRINTYGNTHVHTGKNIYIHADSEIHVLSGSDTLITTGDDTHIKTGKNTHIESGEKTHVKTGSNAYVYAKKEIHLKADAETFITSKDNLHLRSDKKVLIYGESGIDIRTPGGIGIKGSGVKIGNGVIIKDAVIQGIITNAIECGGEPFEVKGPEPEIAEKAKTAEGAKEADPAEIADKGPKADGGAEGWGKKLARLVYYEE